MPVISPYVQDSFFAGANGFCSASFSSSESVPARAPRVIADNLHLVSGQVSATVLPGSTTASGGVVVHALDDNYADTVVFEVRMLDEYSVFEIVTMGDPSSLDQPIRYSTFYTADNVFQFRIESTLSGPSTTDPPYPGDKFRLVWRAS